MILLGSLATPPKKALSHIDSRPGASRLRLGSREFTPGELGMATNCSAPGTHPQGGGSTGTSAELQAQSRAESREGIELNGLRLGMRRARRGPTPHRYAKVSQPVHGPAGAGNSPGV